MHENANRISVSTGHRTGLLVIGLVAVLLTSSCTCFRPTAKCGEEGAEGSGATAAPAEVAPPRQAVEPESTTATASTPPTKVVTQPSPQSVEQPEKPSPTAPPAVAPGPTRKGPGESQDKSTTGQATPAEPDRTAASNAAKAPEVAQSVAKPAPPPLDLDSLEKRLRNTDAIGLFTKLALKNQVDDLLQRFRTFYQGHSDTTLAQLRRPYDLLIMKVLALLQDDDPSLAHDILKSRESIWDILSDPNKFAAYSQR